MGTSTYTEILPSLRDAMTDPRQIRFSCLSTPRIEKQQTQNTYIRAGLRFYILEMHAEFTRHVGNVYIDEVGLFEKKNGS